MKQKTFNKKLILKRQTVAHLSEKEMKKLKGAGTQFACTRTCVDTKCFC